MQPVRLRYNFNGSSFWASDLTSGLNAVRFVTELETNQAFYRTKWQGSVIFTGEDFDRLWSIFQRTCCLSIPVSFFRAGNSCSPDTPYWQGISKLTDFSFDVNTGTATMKNAPVPDDGYQTVFETWESEYNWLDTDEVFSVFSPDRFTLYKRARKLLDVLAQLTARTVGALSPLAPLVGIGEIVSSFLEDAVNPVTRRVNHLKDSLLIQGSDFAQPGTVSGIPVVAPARTALLTLKDLLDELRELLNLYWYIDSESGRIRFEHSSFFPHHSYGPPPAGLILDNDNPAWQQGKVVTTDPSSLYGKYSLSISGNLAVRPGQQTDADGKVIDAYSTLPADYAAGLNKRGAFLFSDACITRLPGESVLEKTRTVNKIVTDVFSARLINPDGIDKENGLFLVSVVPSTDPASTIPQIQGGYPAGTDAFGDNSLLMEDQLLTDFHRHDQPFSSAKQHTLVSPYGVQRGMLSVAPVRELNTVTISHCCTDTPVSLRGLITTWLSDNGVLQKAEYTPATERLSLTIRHPGPCQTPEYNAPAPATPGEVITSCKPKGEVLRTSTATDYGAADPLTGYTPLCGVTITTFYADGVCGEYREDKYNPSGFCK